MSIVIAIIQIILAIAVIALVMMQTGKSGLSGAIAGSADSFMAKNKNVGKEAKLALLTKIVAAVFVVVTFVLSLI